MFHTSPHSQPKQEEKEIRRKPELLFYRSSCLWTRTKFCPFKKHMKIKKKNKKCVYRLAVLTW